MKISLKIFIFTYCIMMFATITGGFFLINYSYLNDLNKARETAINNNKTLYTYVVTLEELPDSIYAEYSLTGLSERMSDGSGKVFIGNYDEWKKQIVIDTSGDSDENASPNENIDTEKPFTKLEKETILCSIIDQNGRKVFQVTSRYKDRYIINYYDISEILAQRDSNYILYRNVIVLTSVIIAVILYLFSWYITRPLVKVTAAAREISTGDYSVRIDSSYQKMKSYEVEKLGETLNLLAGNTENYIAQLKDAARKKEDFMGNFTHEIKTPLTSIIGYADLMRTYDLTPEKRHEYSNFIYREGKRLEQLALNLLQLIVMDKTDFTTKEISARAFFEQLRSTVVFLADKYHVKIRIHYTPATFHAEVSLLLTAVMNLVDNACKASEQGQHIFIMGKIEGDFYIIQVIDKGRGIPTEQIDKITEPFYMVDKSRARSQGGAGLGLALCHKIAALHGGDLEIRSILGQGTIVKLSFQLKPDSVTDITGTERTNHITEHAPDAERTVHTSGNVPDTTEYAKKAGDHHE